MSDPGVISAAVDQGPNVITLQIPGQTGAKGDTGDTGATGSAGESLFNDHGSVAGTVTIDRTGSVNVHKITLSAAVDLVFDGWPDSGTYGEIVLEIVNGGAFSVSYPAEVMWLTPDAVAPTLSTGSEVLVFTTTDGGTTVEGFSSTLDALSASLENQSCTGGIEVTEKDLGTVSSGTLTLDMGDRPMQKYVNGGAHTLAPGTVIGGTLLSITNNASAGAITTSGWTKVVGSFTTTNTDKFLCHASVSAVGSLLIIQAMQ